MFEQEEKDILVFLRKVLLNVALLVASPFLMLAFLFFLLQKPPLWSLVPLAIGLAFVALGLAAFLYAKVRLRQARERVERAIDQAK